MRKGSLNEDPARRKPQQSGGSGMAVAAVKPSALKSSFRLRAPLLRLLPEAALIGGPSTLLLTPRRSREMKAEQGRGTAGACGVEQEFGLRRPRGLNSRGGVGAWATGVLVGWWAGPARFPWTLH